MGDSAEEDAKEKFESLFSSLEKLLECDEEWNLTIKDPLANSFILPLKENIEEDARLTIEQYERSTAENEEYGIDVLQKMDQEQ